MSERTMGTGRAALLAALAILGGEPLMAQEGQPPQGPPVEPELVFEREIFVYPEVERRNPFKPLVAADAGGPRFEQLRLSGIIYSLVPDRSVAVFNTGAVMVAEDGTLTAEEGESYFARVGERIGNVTVIEIARDSVVVEVEEFGIADRKVMRPLNLRGGNQ